MFAGRAEPSFGPPGWGCVACPAFIEAILRVKRLDRPGLAAAAAGFGSVSAVVWRAAPLAAGLNAAEGVGGTEAGASAPSSPDLLLILSVNRCLLGL